MQLLSSVKQLVAKKAVQLALVTLLYYVCLVFVNANIHLLIVTSLYALAVFWLVKTWWLALWFVLLVTLPLAKGKTLVYTLIPKEDLVARNAIFDINYILSFYLSDGVLLLLYWLIVRQPIQHLKSVTQIFKPLRWLSWTFLLFLAVTIWPHRDATLLPIILLSCGQLIKTCLVFLLPTVVLSVFADRKKQFWFMTQIAFLSGVFLQTTLTLLQFFNNGPLGWYIEAILPLGKSGEPIAISTMENADILRVSGSFFDPSLLGSFMFSMMIWLWYQKPGITPLWLKWASITAANVAILLTSNRLLMVTLLVWWCYQALSFFKQNYYQKKRFLKTQFSWLLGFVVVLLILAMPYLSNRLNSLTSLFAKYGSGTYRIELARYAMRLVAEQPWGVGLNLSPYYLATQFNQEIVSFDPSPPHNIFFQLLAETGYVGVALAVWLFYLIYRPMLGSKAPQPKFLVTGAGMAGLAFVYCAQFYPVFINQIETFSWLMIFLGLYWAEKQKFIHAKK